MVPVSAKKKEGIEQLLEMILLLAEVENGDLRAAVSQKRAALASAQAKLAALQAGTRPESIAIAQATVTSAQQTLINTAQDSYTAADAAVHNQVDQHLHQVQHQLVQLHNSQQAY